MKHGYSHIKYSTFFKCLVKRRYTREKWFELLKCNLFWLSTFSLYFGTVLKKTTFPTYQSAPFQKFTNYVRSYYTEILLWCRYTITFCHNSLHRILPHFKLKLINFQVTPQCSNIAISEWFILTRLQSASWWLYWNKIYSLF